MQRVDTITENFLRKNIGNYAQFGGFGIVDGTKSPPCKMGLWLILEVNPDLASKEKGVTLKGYRQRFRSFLPERKYAQRCIVYTKKEHKKFPVYNT